MNINDFIDELITELAYRLDSGIPDLKNKQHLLVLSEILVEWGMSELESSLLPILTEDEPPVKSKEDKNYSHKAYGYYVKKGDEGKDDAQIYRKDGERYISVSKDEYDEKAKKQGELGTKATGADTKSGEATQADQPQQNVKGSAAFAHAPDIVNKKKSDDKSTTLGITVDGEKNQVEVKDFKRRIEKSSMTNEAKAEANELVDKLSVIFDKNKSKEEVMETLSSINISISSNKKKLYLDDMRKYGGGLYKILGEGTKSIISTINKIAEYMELPEDNNKMAIELEAVAKPDLGSQNIRSVYKKTAKGFTEEVNDINVERLFQTPPLDRIETPKFKSLFGPLDDNGNLLTPSSNNSKEYLKFSIENNISIDNTINVLERYASEGKISPNLANSVKSHKQKMNDILNNMEIPSEEAAVAVDASYATMFDELMKQNQDLASRMLKQFAEMRLYDSEIAKGDEAYLPGDGSFPAGDKLVFKNGAGGTERVSFVSVKYGKNGDVYGCPANSKALQTLHPDPNKRNRQGQYIGESGYTLAINDELVEDEETTKSTIKSMISEMPDIQGILSEEEITKIAETVFKTKERVGQLKSKYEKDGKVDKVGWAKLQKDLLKDSTMIELNKNMQELISVEKFTKMIGSRNGKVSAKYDFGAAHFMSGLCFANQVVTSNGYEGVTHNKQYYDNGVLESATVAGTTDRDEWYINFRMYRTSGRAGGGAQVSYIGKELKEKHGDSQIGELK